MEKRSKRSMPKEVKEFDEAVVEVSRVTRVVKGGRRMRFRATVVIGNKKGTVGYGIGKAAEVQQAIQKAVAKARKRLIRVPIYKGSIPHQTQVKFKASVVFMKPASEGTGLIAGGAVRQILELAGVKNVLSKSLGSTNRVNTAKATYKALLNLRERSDMEVDRVKEEKAKDEDRSAPEAKKISRKDAKDMVHADKKMNRPNQKSAPKQNPPKQA
jgi:small subunit ribosomal protein S5